MRALHVMLAAAGLVASVPIWAQQPADAGAEAERMLAAVGGREAWAEAVFYRIVAHHHPPMRATGPYINIIEMDMTAPRMRLEGRGPGTATLRLVDGNHGWRRVDDRFEPLTDDDVASEYRWWNAHVYRMFHRIAAREPGLEPRIGRDGRLEFWKNGAFIMWYRLGVDGAPYLFGTTLDGPRWTLLGPFVQTKPSGARYPRWTAWSDGTFRTDSILFEVSGTTPATVSYRPPE